MLVQRNPEGAGVITRINLITHSTDWNRSYSASGAKLEYVAALSIKPDQSSMAAALSELEGARIHRIFTVNVEDGFVTSPLFVLNHGT